MRVAFTLFAEEQLLFAALRAPTDRAERAFVFLHAACVAISEVSSECEIDRASFKRLLSFRRVSAQVVFCAALFAAETLLATPVALGYCR